MGINFLKKQQYANAPSGSFAKKVYQTFSERSALLLSKAQVTVRSTL
ncbi:MAG: hypothetical protein ACJA2M_001710 [Polaribacter sp.]